MTFFGNKNDAPFFFFAVSRLILENYCMQKLCFVQRCRLLNEKQKSSFFSINNQISEATSSNSEHLDTYM